jgi:phage replication-related protein YjqB (UPF0714/DUF867 family)
MADVYTSIEELLAHESRHIEIEEQVTGRDRVAVIAPHAGHIEPMTGEIAQAIASRNHRLYKFVGKAPFGNARLHIPSTRFDEPTLRSVLTGCRTAISIHGCSSDEEAVTLIGGVNRTLAALIHASLERAGFAVMDAPAHLASLDPRNLVNRVPEGGVQLELTRRLREDLRSGLLRKGRFDRYVQAIRDAVAEYESRPGPRWDQVRTQPASPSL